ncbi:MAG: GAF domain-containing protein [Acidimicrobiales bacterium]|nr:GAF domain-containing protein [Actinomycetota bacterium]
MTDEPSLADVSLCCEGAVPAVVATASASGTPNVTYLSRVHVVDDERVALSNQFFSKTSRNLVENPRASILLLDPTNYDQFRLSLVYERTERRGPVFERLRADIDALGALEGMQDVFRLRAADIYRVVSIERVFADVHRRGVPRPDGPARRDASSAAELLAELGRRLSRSTDLDVAVDVALTGIDELFGYRHSSMLLRDETGGRLYTIASHGYPAEGIGSEIEVGDGIVGLAAQRCAPVRVGNLLQMAKYSRVVRQSYEGRGHIGPGREIPVPDLSGVDSRLAVPAMAFGELVGVLCVESTAPVAFDALDEALLTVVASQLAAAVEGSRARDTREGAEGHDDGPPPAPPAAAPLRRGDEAHLRFFPLDGSTFLDGDYLIKGVAGRLLWSLLVQHEREGRTDFTNREVRLDPTLELPEFRDNFESRLILLKRRLDERRAPVRIEKTGRGRFRLTVERPVRLETTNDGGS